MSVSSRATATPSTMMSTRSTACRRVCLLVYFAFVALCSSTTQVIQVAAYTTQIRPSQLKRQKWETQPTTVEVLKPPLPPPKKTKKIHPPFTWGPSIWERVTELAVTHDTSQGKVISANKGGVVVKITSLGFKGNVKAFVPNSHLPSSSGSTNSNTELIGRVLPIKIVSITKNNTQKQSLPRVVATIPAPSIWGRVTYIFATNEITQGKVISVNKGGMIVKITSDGYKGNVNAFLPNSYYFASSSSTSTTTTTTSSNKKKELIGRVLPIQIVSMTDTPNHAHPQVVVSHKSALAQFPQLNTDHDYDDPTIASDLVTDGIVTAITAQGALISFTAGAAGLTKNGQQQQHQQPQQQQGLLHKNHISFHDWKLVPTPTNDGYIIDACFRDEKEKCGGETNQVLLKIGSRVKCLILHSNNNLVEEDDEGHGSSSSRISLSTEALEPKPGDMLCDPERVFAKAQETLAAKFYASHILR
eukprot:CAMPEP_0170951316 /NCGR_PEP_ID=MMETSP0735-20130129/30571_1 /TAXON_ID=186038 /ORGANISM="Fragilariopsis kerguelensis, Strain L26-C5" /LENGTH=472 /DNA_ID=CAMNT_0011362093 /DNA_START=274 /DNA_END=1695 /DNA_ORIENTATION=+